MFTSGWNGCQTVSNACSPRQTLGVPNPTWEELNKIAPHANGKRSVGLNVCISIRDFIMMVIIHSCAQLIHNQVPKLRNASQIQLELYTLSHVSHNTLIVYRVGNLHYLCIITSSICAISRQSRRPLSNAWEMSRWVYHGDPDLVKLLTNLVVNIMHATCWALPDVVGLIK